MWVVWVIFPKIPTIFPNDGKNEFFFKEKGNDFLFFFTFVMLRQTYDGKSASRW